MSTSTPFSALSDLVVLCTALIALRLYVSHLLVWPGIGLREPLPDPDRMSLSSLIGVPRWPTRMRVVKVLASSLALVPYISLAADRTGEHVALVIGNAAYSGAPLVNSLNDASKMAERLRKLGFKVIEVRDGSKQQMTSAIDSARAALEGKGGVGMFYYAGHGMQMDWRNYLVPVDARLATAQDVIEQTLDLEMVMSAFKAARTRMNIVVLDACRDNPFAKTATGKGLAPVDAPTGTFVAYATAPGNVAQDGTEQSGHGLYTQHLLEELAQPEARLEDVFKRVRTKVRKQSRGQQIPWEVTSLEDDFYFNRLAADVIDKPLAPGTLEDLMRRRVVFDVQKADWDRIRDSESADDFYAYLDKYPDGYMSEMAQFRLDQLQRPELKMQKPKGDISSPLPSGRRRYEIGDQWAIERTDNLGYTKKTLSFKVTAADDARVVINDGEMVRDQMGSIIKDVHGTRDPGILVAPADIAVGKKWRSAFANVGPTGVPSQGFMDMRVTAVETISTPAGQFRAYRLTMNGSTLSANGVTQLGGTIWLDPASMHIIKAEYQYFFGGKRIFDTSDVVVSIQQVTRKP